MAAFTRKYTSTHKYIWTYRDALESTKGQQWILLRPTTNYSILSSRCLEGKPFYPGFFLSGRARQPQGIAATRVTRFPLSGRARQPQGIAVPPLGGRYASEGVGDSSRHLQNSMLTAHSVLAPHNSGNTMNSFFVIETYQVMRGNHSKHKELSLARSLYLVACLLLASVPGITRRTALRSSAN